MPIVENSYPFNGGEGGAELLRTVLNSLFLGSGIAPGVSEELSVEQNSPTGMSVRVNPGVSLLGNDSIGLGLYRLAQGSDDQILSVPANNTGSTRQDYVVVFIDTTIIPPLKNTGLLYRTGGVSPPTLVNTSTRVEEALAQVAVTNGAVSITNTMITDKRNDPVVGGYLRPRGIIDPVDLLRPINLTRAKGLIFSKKTAAAPGVIGTVPAGKVWIILNFCAPDFATGSFNWGNSVTVDNNIAYLLNVSNLSVNTQLVIPAGQSIYGSTTGLEFTYIELSAPSDGRTYIKITLPRDGSSAVIPHATKRFVPTWIFAESSAYFYIYDSVIGTSLKYFMAQPKYDIDEANYTYGANYSNGPYSSQLQQAFIVPPNRAIKVSALTGAPTTNVNLYGYLEDSNETVV